MGALDIGKSETALTIAKLLNCTAPKDGMYCNTCATCLKIQSGNYPDIHRISSEEGEAIKIEQIRDLLNQNKLRTYEAAVKVFIIKNAENMTTESANAFLKTLEEPSANSLIILTTSVPEKISATIRSRCHFVYFRSRPKEMLVGMLAKTYSMDKPQAQFLASFAEGCWGRAKKLEQEKFYDTKNEIIDRFILGRHPARGVGREAAGPVGEAYIKSILADKKQLKELLNVVLSWVRDCYLIKNGVPEKDWMHNDRSDDLMQFQQQYSFGDLTALKEEVVGTMNLLTENLNVKIPLMIIQERMSHG